ncbi:MAG: cell wall metabolism sensor histidine kinase WalK [Clostridia bacterium]|nr:cell wall metabolism sensor histidine kinase WalK [Clostridia bacterium]
MKLSLRHKIIAVNLTVLLLTFAVISFIVIDRLSAVNTNMLVENLKYQADLSVISVRQSLLSGGDPANVENAFTSRGKEFATKLANEYRIRVAVFSSARQKIADSDPSETAIPQYKELDEVFKGNRAYAIRTAEGSRYLYFSFPVVYQKVIGAVMFIYPLKEIDNMTRNIQVYLLISFLLGLVVIVAVALYLSVKITKPITILRESALKIAAGKFQEKIAITSSDETGELARAFNQMSNEIENRMTLLTLEKSKLNSVLESMGEGVVALDGKNEILLINHVAKSILHLGIDSKIIKLADKVRQQQSRVILEIDNGDRNILICATPLKQELQNDGVVLILNDVTELRLLQEKQKQFVTNVSHELKTPLTTILGYVDLLKEKGDHKEIFTTSLHHLQSASDRLLRLVNDLIDLSMLKKSEFEIEPRSTDFTELVRDIVGQMSLKAQKFNIELDIRLPDTGEINIDPVRIKQAVVNVLDNAIKYSQGGKISVVLTEYTHQISLVISDTGCGIPRNLLENIFEPFYRVDKARSRDLGGNGLGLAITKEIIEKHGGTIHIESKEGQGTSVEMTLPQ